MNAGSIHDIHIRTLAEDTQGETVIRVDRTHPVLGNRHILKSKLDKGERARVIAAYQEDLDADLAINGPMSQAVLSIAERVQEGEDIALACHCAPLPCHGDVIAEAVRRFVKQNAPPRSDALDRLAGYLADPPKDNVPIGFASGHPLPTPPE